MSLNYNAYPFSRWIKWAIIGFILLILVFSSISTYNGLVVLDQNVSSSWSQVENVMQRRADLITSQVEVVKGYVKLEEKVISEIAAARSVLYNGGSDIQSKLAADEQIRGASKSMLVLVENYPNLKASEQFTNLQKDIEGSENRISVERKRFIEATQLYNTKVSRFPGNIFAKFLGFQQKKYFEALPGAQKPPEIKF